MVIGRSALALILGFPLIAAAAPPPAVSVEFFSPQGTVKQVRQAVARFSAPVVALGDPRLPDPFDIACPAPGKGRWADTRNWVYDFDEDLPAGLRCQFALKKNLTTTAGAAVTAPRPFVFDTGGPAIQASFPYDGWEALDEEQIFLLKLDAPATPESVRKHAHCVIEGVGERVPIELLTGTDREAVLAQRKSLGYAYYQLLWKSGDVSDVRVRDRALEIAEERIAVVRCQRRLPAATKVQLVWDAGIATPSGIATKQAQKLAFRVRPAFTARVECTRTEPRAGCMPIKPITLIFSAPVSREQALAARLRIGGTGKNKDELRVPILPEEGKSTQNTPATASAKQAMTVESVTFEAPFPDGGTVMVELPAGLKDDAGRPPENAARFPLEVRIDEFPPLVKFAAEFGILEAREGGVLPVTLRNIETQAAAGRTTIPGKRLRVASDPAEVAKWMQRVENAMEPHGEHVLDEKTQTYRWREDTGLAYVLREEEGAEAFAIDKPAGSRPAEVVGIPLGAPGFYVVEIASERLGASLLGRPATRYVAATALVTNLAVHFKWGRESSRVWVTRLDTGAPVPNAEVAVSSYCSGAQMWQGRTDRDGVAVVDASIGAPHGGSSCRWPPQPLMVTAKTADDFSFALSNWSDGITPYNFNMTVGGEWSANIFHTVLDRPLFRAGETVSMKHFLRRHVSAGVTTPQPVGGAYKVTISHAGSDQRYTSTVNFGADGVGEQQWKIPAEAKLGDYSISIQYSPTVTLQSGRFKVEEFRLPTMRASVKGPADPQVRPRDVTLDLHVGYLSGGGASGMPVKVRTLVEPRVRQPAGYDDYTFGGAPVKEGIDTSAGGRWDFDPEAEEETSASKTQVLPTTLDAQGAARITIPNLPAVDNPSQLVAELEYADANGELLTTTGRVQLVPSALTVGIRTDGWAASAEQLRFRVVALDLQDRPVVKQKVIATLYQSTAYSYRKRLIGGFYAYETVREIRKLPKKCEGTTNAQGLLLCELAPGVSGEVLVRVETRDAQGQIAGATRSMWVAGDEDWWFGGTEGDRMDVLPEQKEYEAGQTARFQVRMPFRAATALVTVEREGVLSSFVTKLSGRSPVIEVPIASNYAPNIYVSVLAVRGRVASKRLFRPGDEKEITALVDLNKPAFRLGAAEIKVGWKPHRLDVRVTPERQTYGARERVKVSVEVKRADGTLLPAGAEVALAAVDEALLELSPNKSWELLEAMMGRRGLEVWTATAQMQVVGKRHYGRKAVPHGGGGGRERARESFDTLLAWQGRVKLDANGRAQVEVPLNDSLTSFRIVAVAHAGVQLFGTGAASIVTTQDLILLSGLPPLVREGDKYAATFTVRNTGKRPMTAALSAKVTPALKTALMNQSAEIPAGEAREVVWKVEAPVGTARLVWEVTAQDLGGQDRQVRDAVKIVQNVIPAWQVRTYQATIAQLTAPLEMPAERPKGAVPGRGGLEVSLRAKLGDGLDGVREFMSRYPYICLEQNLSRAVALRDKAMWDNWMARLPAYMDRDGLLKYFNIEWLQGEDVLSAYTLAIAQEAGWEIPEPQRQQIVQGLTKFVEGRIVRNSALPTADLAVRKLAAINALSRHGAAQPSMLDSITIEPNLWPTSAVLDWLGILRRMPNTPRAAEQRGIAEVLLRARLNFQGTTMGFTTERSDALWWLMISTDSNAVRMLLEVLDREQWREDIPRLVRGALGRQQRGHWNTTVANAWGVLAMEKFSAAFESTPVTGSTAVSYGSQTKSTEWAQKKGADQVDLPWQEGRKQLAVKHEGAGAPWAMIRATAALPLDKPLSTGFKIVRTVTPVEQKTAGQWSRGDVLRVKLELEAQSDMTWVAVEDPVPAGSSLLGSGLSTQSQLLTREERSTGWVWPAFEERKFEVFRAYYRFVPKGRWTVEYTVRLNNPGTFLLPATRVEAMYAPEMLGELPNAVLTVHE